MVNLPTGATTISNGSELFGSATVMPNGQTAANGFAALSAFASSSETEITANDPIFNQLQVWVDTGLSGSTPTGQLFTLSELGIKSLNLNATVASVANNGNTIGLLSSFTTTDGTTHQMADVWLASANGTQSTTAQLTAALNSYASASASSQFGLNSDSLNATLASRSSSHQALAASSTMDNLNSLSNALTQSMSKYPLSHGSDPSASNGAQINTTGVSISATSLLVSTAPKIDLTILSKDSKS